MRLIRKSGDATKPEQLQHIPHPAHVAFSSTLLKIILVEAMLGATWLSEIPQCVFRAVIKKLEYPGRYSKGGTAALRLVRKQNQTVIGIVKISLVTIQRE